MRDYTYTKEMNMENNLSRIIANLQTDHPGGYADIFGTLARLGSQQIKYDVVRRVQAPDDPTKYVDQKTVCAIYLSEVHAKIEDVLKNTPAISGLIAGAICHVLVTYGLPGPGDKAWEQPAEKWLKGRLA